jgi:uncharacterized phage-associated protein
MRGVAICHLDSPLAGASRKVWLYLVDREALLRFGRPVTGDRVVAMKHGPVLSRVYDLVSHRKQQLPTSEWHQFIPRPGRYVYTVRFSGVPETSSLSEAEVALIDEVCWRFQDKDEWELVDFAHTLPEWRDPGDTSAPIPYEDILRAAGASEEDVAAISENAAADSYMDSVIAQVRG